MSQVSGAHLRGFVPGPTYQGCATVAGCWEHVGDLIGSGFEPHTSCTRSKQSYYLCHLAKIPKMFRLKSLELVLNTATIIKIITLITGVTSA